MRVASRHGAAAVAGVRRRDTPCRCCCCVSLLPEIETIECLAKGLDVAEDLDWGSGLPLTAIVDQAVPVPSRGGRVRGLKRGRPPTEDKADAGRRGDGGGDGAEAPADIAGVPAGGAGVGVELDAAAAGGAGAAVGAAGAEAGADVASAAGAAASSVCTGAGAASVPLPSSAAALDMDGVQATLRALVPRKLPPLPQGDHLITRQQALIRGHTSFLTFATLWLK